MAAERSVRLEAAGILYRVYQTDAYADILIDNIRNQCSFSTQDCALLSELVYGTLRWKGRLDYSLRQVYHGEWKKLPVKIQVLLETGLYQIVHLDRIPDFAAIHETVQLVKKWADPHWTGTVNAILRRLANEHDTITLPSRSNNLVQAISVEYSHPAWLVEEWLKIFGPDRTEAICRANNEKPVLSLRVNRLKSRPSEVLKILSDKGFLVHPGKYLKEFLILSDGKGLFETDLFQKGAVTVQDESAGLAVRLLDPQPGEFILDMSAAPGGKTGYIVEQSANQANIIAMDHHFGRLQRMRKTLNRLGHNDVHMVYANAHYLPCKSVDKILLDAQCSGIGVLRKRAELRWRVRLDQIKKLTEMQKAMLDQAAKCIDAKGVIVYSTCTVMKQENQEIASWFIKKYPQFVIEPAYPWIADELVAEQGWVQSWPDRHNIDGSFAVRFKTE